MGGPPLSSIDTKIDELGKELNIHSARDAEAYINALLEKYRIDDARLPGLLPLKERLVAAEYAAVQDHSKMIQERVVADVFNKIMERWNTPAWTRISPDELHAFRIMISRMRYPNSVPRSPDGHLAHRCRPVEALYLIYLLDSNRRMLSRIRELLESGRWPGEEKFLEHKKIGVLRPSTKSGAELAAERQYDEARRELFARRYNNQDLTTWVGELFAALDID